MIVEDGGLWEIRISVTLPATHAGMELPPTVIGRRASLGGSAAPSDWPCVLGPANGPPGGIWIGFIRRTVEHGQSIVAVTVTGSLRFPKLLSRRDIHAPSIVLMKMRNIEQKKMVPVISWDSCRGGGGGGALSLSTLETKSTKCNDGETKYRLEPHQRLSRFSLIPSLICRSNR